MFSRFLRTKEKMGVVAVFHELHPDPIFFTTEEWARISSGNIEDSEYQDLRNRKLVVHSSESDDKEFDEIEKDLEKKFNHTSILYLMTAQGCNLECTYCPVPYTARKYGESMLSKENAFAGIDLWLEHLKDAYNPKTEYFVIFYGGEPLLNKSVIVDSVSYLMMKKDAGKLPDNINIMISTNGTLIDDETIVFCRENNIMVAVGLDGPKSSNDSMKVKKDGSGTFDEIVSVIESLVKNGVRTFASVSITPNNINEIHKYSDFFKKLRVEKFGFNFLKGRLLLEVVGKEGLVPYYRAASRGIISNAQNQVSYGFEYQMEKKQSAFDTGNFFPVDCTCYGNQLVIQPDGQISNCPFFRSQLGNVSDVGKDFRIWEQEIVREWRKRLPIYHKDVSKSLHGGGCAWSSYEIYGDHLATDDSSVILSEEALDELIWSRYK